MKILRFLLLILIVSLYNSCTVDDDYESNPTLLGSWNLIEVSGTIAGTTDQFEYGLITWNFEEGTVTVVNNNTDESLLDGFDSGNYDFLSSVNPTAESCSRTLSFSPEDVNCIAYDYENLVISQNIADGLTFRFIR
jgi:hypothetical protein